MKASSSTRVLAALLLALAPASVARATALRVHSSRLAPRARPLATAEPPVSVEAAFSLAAAAALSSLAADAALAPASSEASTSARPRSGGVYLVGTGPGDPELLTLKAFRLLASAELILYDRLVSAEILKLASPSATLVYVGKERDLHSRSQDEIHKLLLWYAGSQRLVVRLKGGDPTVFGRGGEELEFLEQRGFAVTLVPGITAAAGVAACLGVPLTHRDHADSVRFITGHSRKDSEPLTARQRKQPPAAGEPERGAAADGAARAVEAARAEARAVARRAGPLAAADDSPPPPLDLDFEKLACARTTLVVYMGLATLPQLTAGLIAAGLGADTPACAVQEGTAPGQRVVRCALGGLADAVTAHKLRSPTLVFIGGVVSLLTDERMAQAAADAAARADGSAIFKYLADGPASSDPLHVAALRRGALITPAAL